MVIIHHIVKLKDQPIVDIDFNGYHTPYCKTKRSTYS